MKKTILLLLICLVLGGCGAGNVDIDSELNSETETQVELTAIGEYENCVIELKEADVYVTESGEQMIRVKAKYTNNNEEPLYASCSFAIRAYQNNVQIEDVSDINGTENTLIQEVKNGESIEVSYVFKLVGDVSVEVLIGTPTADEITIGKAVYDIELAE